MGYGNDKSSQILDLAHGKSSQELKHLKDGWIRQMSSDPEGFVVNGREAFYGTVIPALDSDPDVPPEAKQVVTSLLEACFETIQSGTKSRTRSGSSS